MPVPPFIVPKTPKQPSGPRVGPTGITRPKPTPTPPPPPPKKG
jgi:hypothetical protein